MESFFKGPLGLCVRVQKYTKTQISFRAPILCSMFPDRKNTQHFVGQLANHSTVVAFLRCNSYGRLWLGELTVWAHWGMWLHHRTTRGSLCQPGERREGICPQQPCGARRGGLLSIQHIHALVWSQGRARGGRPKKNRGDHFAGEHVWAQWPLCPQFVPELSLCHLFMGDGWERAIQRGN